MIRFTLTQMRLNAGRLAAAGLAVLLGTAFVAAALLAGDLLTATLHRAVSATYRGADVVVTAGPTSPNIPAAQLAKVRRLPEVDGADPQLDTHVQLVAGNRHDIPHVQALPGTPALRTATVTTGRLPATTGEIALAPELAQRLRVGVGDPVVARTSWWLDGDSRPGSRLRVVGLLTRGDGFGLTASAVATDTDVTTWQAEQGAAPGFATLLAHAAPGVNPQRARDAIAAVGGWGSATIRTGAVQADADTRRLTGQVDMLTAVLLGFAGIALFVASLVIMNTFQVLVAQRTRTLALLRCVGATRRQIRRTVLQEATLLGALTSVTGLLVGTGLVNGMAAVLSRMDLRVSVPGTVAPSAASIGLPLLLGTVVTALAALAPARMATRVAPVAALRPAAPPTLRSRASVLRLVIAGSLLTVGGALLAGGPLLSSRGHDASGGLMAMAGGAVSFLGVLASGSVLVPRLVQLVGRLAGRYGGVPARLAAANAARNPRRTATTSLALLIGVTLVATMSTGAAVVLGTLDRQLDHHFPVDLVIGDQPVNLTSSEPSRTTPIPAAVAPAASKVAGVTTTLVLDGGQVQVRGGTGPARGAAPATDAARGTAPATDPTPGTTPWVSIDGVPPDRAAETVHDRAGIAGLAAGSVIVPEQIAREARVRTGDLLQLSSGERTVRLRAVVTTLGWQGLLVTPPDLRTVLPSAAPAAVWLRLDPSADVTAVVKNVQEAVVTATGAEHAVPVAGAALDRSAYTQVIDTMLLVVTGLLAVAVAIALIGVANTLSLSVIERTRESAVLRAVGLTRAQLRGMLAVEGGLIAGTGALAGVGLGLVYGWAGAASVIGGRWRPALVVPVGHLALLLVGGVLAGLAASVLPARRAARTAPVAALGD